MHLSVYYLKKTKGSYEDGLLCLSYLLKQEE